MAKCVLEIRDEVNVKFVGLDVKTRRAISDEAKYFLPYAYHMPAYKLGRWDGCVRYCDIGGRTYFHFDNCHVLHVVGLDFSRFLDLQISRCPDSRLSAGMSRGPPKVDYW